MAYNEYLVKFSSTSNKLVIATNMENAINKAKEVAETTSEPISTEILRKNLNVYLGPSEEVVNFSPIYDSTEGRVYPSSVRGTRSTKFNVIAIPNPGYKFVQWHVEEGGFSTDVVEAHPGDYAKAFFEKIEGSDKFVFNTVYDIDKGIVHGDSIQVKEGDNITVTAEATPGYKFEGWYTSRRDYSTATTYTIQNVSKSDVVVAVFIPDNE